MKYSVRTGVQRAWSKIAAVITVLAAVAFPAAIVLNSGVASAAANYTLFGDASIVSGGNPGQAVQTRSIGSGFGGINFTVPSGMTLNDLNNLSTDFKATQGGCGGGSPRFQVNVVTTSGTKNLFVYLGTAPSYTCPLNTWVSSGNLAAPTNLVDATQLGGTFYEPYSLVHATYGTDAVTGIQLVTDAGWLFGTQTVLFDNTQINSTLYTYDQPQNAEACKQGGWANLMNENNQPFKNQGQCIAWVNHNNGVGQDDNHAANR